MKRRRLFREVNERIRDVNESFTVGAALTAIDVFCECGQNGCLERVQVPAAVYEQTREQDGHFLVSPGHEAREHVLEGGETYRIVILGGEPVKGRPGSMLRTPAGVFTEAF